MSRLLDRPSALLVFLFLSLLLLRTPRARALHVASDSPCSQACLDDDDDAARGPSASASASAVAVAKTNSSALAAPRTNSSAERRLCRDEQFDSEPRGVRFKTCVRCLQGSTYSMGHESDQAWLLYDLRHTFTTCTLPSPHDPMASGLSTCAAPETCGHLAAALGHGVPDGNATWASRGPGGILGYCDAIDGAVAAGFFFQTCLQFLIALATACSVKPSSLFILPLPLNDTIFAKHAIQATSMTPRLRDHAITAVTVAVPAALLLLAASCAVFIILHLRRRRRRLRRLEPCDNEKPAPLMGGNTCTRYHDRDDPAEEYYAERFFEKTPLESRAEGGFAPEDVITASMSPVARSKPVRWENLDFAAEGSPQHDEESSGRWYAWKAFGVPRTWSLHARTGARSAPPRAEYTSPGREMISAPPSGVSPCSSSSSGLSPGTGLEEEEEKQYGMSGEGVSSQHGMARGSSSSCSAVREDGISPVMSPSGGRLVHKGSRGLARRCGR
ncbi:hypothetical protein E4U43_002367 [Claviceps pusilla]|uniref:Uncharacterized protein n=1 Tax=Claviceps pusilla TaxID=123648 RepID=A0A9P7N770_9HYPO|nr:hypothetical protein E4U43_002367 [Claviceps pusilla]